MNPKVVAEVKKLYYFYYGREGLCEYRIEHPAFAKWHSRRNYRSRFQTILSVVGDVRGKRILDAGCAEGAFCHHLAERGANVVGIDYCSWRIDLAKAVAKLYGLSPKNPLFQPITFERFLRWKGAGQFDFILFLSLFHHNLRKGLESTWEKMQMVSEHTGMMFMEADVHAVHCRRLMKKVGCTEKQLRRVIPQSVVKHSEFTQYRELPAKRLWRPLFLFSKGE